MMKSYLLLVILILSNITNLLAQEKNNLDDILKELEKEKETKDDHLKELHNQHIEKIYKAIEDTLKLGNETSKKVLDAFLIEFENHPLGNPLSKKAQEIYQQAKLERDIHFEKVNKDWLKIKPQIQLANAKSKLLLDEFIEKYKNHPLGNPLGQEAQALFDFHDEKKHQEKMEAHFLKLKQEWDAIKPTVEKGDDLAEKTLNHFLKKYEDHPLGNPLKQEAQTCFTTIKDLLRTQKEEKEKSDHLNRLKIEWEEIKTTVEKGDDLAEKTLNHFLKKYEDHPLGNPLKQEAQTLLIESKELLRIQTEKIDHLNMLKKEWEEIKPTVEKADDLAEKTLNDFLRKYEDHPLGNPLKQEAQIFFTETQELLRTQKEEKEKSDHLNMLKKEWEEIKPTVGKGDALAEKTLKDFLKKYEDHPLGNPLNQEAQTFFQETIKSKYDQEIQEVEGINTLKVDHINLQHNMYLEKIKNLETDWTRLQKVLDGDPNIVSKALTIFLKKYKNTLGYGIRNGLFSEDIQGHLNILISKYKLNINIETQENEKDIDKEIEMIFHNLIDSEKQKKDLILTDDVSIQKEAKLSELRQRSIANMRGILAKNSQYGKKADVLFRIAEAEWDESKYHYFLKKKEYDKAYEDYLNDKNKEKPQEPIADYKRSIDVYIDLLKDFPNYEKIDYVMFYLGQTLKLVGEAKGGASYMSRLIRSFPNSKFTTSAHLAIAEYYFEKDFLLPAKENYLNVLNDQNAPEYAYALYKISMVYEKLKEYNDSFLALKKSFKLVFQQQNHQLTQAFVRKLSHYYMNIHEGWIFVEMDFTRGKEANQDILVSILEKMMDIYIERKEVELASQLYQYLINKNIQSQHLINYQERLNSIKEQN